MRPHTIVIMIVAVILTIAVPFFLVSQLQLGSYAKSPQEADILLGSTKIVAGGRAKVWFAGGDTGTEYEIRTKNAQKYVSGEVGEEATLDGITVELLEVNLKAHPPRAKFKVSWGK